ncbi:hypothetical protein ZORO111903_09170 [Zobellia roscoffensis]|uniref:hypothetical protein n=1 Tax=Zobellia roscoffensis TaxID=2779508 RepID=UPI00188B1BB9|nr:hypothetical protein [Zobellia roscoffensis]
MIKVIQLLIFIIFFNGISQEINLGKKSCFKEINFDTDVSQLDGFSEPEPVIDNSFVDYTYLHEDDLRDCSQLFGVSFESFKIYKYMDDEIFFGFIKLIDHNSYTINTEALMKYFKAELTRSFGKVQVIEPTIENELKSNVWHWEKEGVFYQLRTWEFDDDLNNHDAIEIYIGKVENLSSFN